MATTHTGTGDAKKGNNDTATNETDEEYRVTDNKPPPWWQSDAAKISYMVTVLSALASLLYSAMQASHDFGELKARVSESEKAIKEIKEDLKFETHDIKRQIEKVDDKADMHHEEILRKLYSPLD